jgi:hypothetical protein
MAKGEIEKILVKDWLILLQAFQICAAYVKDDWILADWEQIFM